MLFSKRYREADKEVKAKKHFVVDSDGDALINVKALKEEQIFSEYNYEINHKLNGELDEYIYDKARFVPYNQHIRMKIYTESNVDEDEVRKAIKNHYTRECLDIRSDMTRTLIFSAVMLVVGLAFFALLLLMHKYFYNAYLDIVIEIIVWVFIWEAVDAYYLKRGKLKRKQKIFLNLCMATIDVAKVVESDDTEILENKKEEAK